MDNFENDDILDELLASLDEIKEGCASRIAAQKDFNSALDADMGAIRPYLDRLLGHAPHDLLNAVKDVDLDKLGFHNLSRLLLILTEFPPSVVMAYGTHVAERYSPMPLPEKPKVEGKPAPAMAKQHAEAMKKWEKDTSLATEHNMKLVYIGELAMKLSTDIYGDESLPLETLHSVFFRLYDASSDDVVSFIKDMRRMKTPLIDKIVRVTVTPDATDDTDCVRVSFWFDSTDTASEFSGLTELIHSIFFKYNMRSSNKQGGDAIINLS
jgi:hypothetical protein